MSNPADKSTRRPRRWLVVAALCAAGGGAGAALLAAGCADQLPRLPGTADDAAAQQDADGCLEQAAAPARLPGVTGDHESLAYWLARTAQPDEVVLSVEDIRAHNQALKAHATGHRDAQDLVRHDLLAQVAADPLRAELKERLGYLNERLADGRYRDAAGKPLTAAELALVAPQQALPPLKDELRQLLADAPLRCGPRLAPLYQAPQLDETFDRNACSTLRKGELVRVLAAWPNGTLLARSDYSIGWLAADTPLSAPLSAEQARALAAAEPKPLTRRALLSAAFELLGSPYGWGGKDGGRDCSRLLMDIFDGFGLRLPRHSSAQARAGSMSVDLSKLSDPHKRLAVIDAAQSRGVVLLHFPGHIMLYLGRDDAGKPMALHAFAEYLTHCDQGSGYDGKPETLRRVDRVKVSDLSLGQGTSRGSFAERITRVTLLSAAPGPGLQGVVERRPSAPVSAAGSCETPADNGVLVVPRRPHPGEPVRVLVSSERDLGSVNLALLGPDGQRLELPLQRSGGPPFGYWGELAAPPVGAWQARLGDGERLAACTRFVVHPKGQMLQAGGGSVWRPQSRWSRATENLFAMFVERLFDYPLDDRTWPNLQELLTARDHNLLFNHLGQGEEAHLALQPDCADLPYFLRAYFAWKLRLPFAYRHCNRGFVGKAPYCDTDLHSNLVSRESSGETAGFADFARHNIADGVHSGSGRTAPQDSNTDYYPVPLTRAGIRPGTMFADPYGHLFVIAGFTPQKLDSYGVLVGADAQPDGTIGRRRFWRGSFLFTPETSEVGAGFKAFRPATYRGGRIRQLTNQQLGEGSGFTPFSMEQYEGTVDSFYDRVEALINPRPLEPEAVQQELIAALFEQVKRRIVSVENGEKYAAEHRAAINMPTGHSIFETTGAWESFSTPSRDMRLLIAMDTVMGFVDAVRRQPARFGVAPAELQAALDKLVALRSSSLEQKNFAYTRSDGAEQRLTLKDVLDRAKGFEVGYNPNDCVEIRWAAPAKSAELSSCKRHAPSHQHKRMLEYRNWFAKRKRPAR